MSRNCLSQLAIKSLIVKVWLMMTVHCKTFRKERRKFVDHFRVCGSFSSFKIETFYWKQLDQESVTEFLEPLKQI